MADNPFKVIEAELDMEFFLDRESIEYKTTRGVNGEQYHIKTCPNPDCGNSNWKVYFGADTGRGNCFVCGTGFTKTKFIHMHFGHEKWGETLRETDALLREQGWRPIRTATVAVVQGKVALPMSDPLPSETGEYLEYLQERGFGPDIALYFGLRWCKFGWWKFTEPDGSHSMQAFNNRIIIPIYDLDGTLQTFQGRDLTGLSDRKYLFPKALPGTGRFLLNAQNAVATDHVALGEGVFDVAAMKMAFDEDVDLRHIVSIGSFGKHLSYGDPEANDQLGRFSALKLRGIKIVTIMWDGEEAALLAALAAGRLLHSIGLTARIALLPPGKDPNEVLPEVVRAAFYKAEAWSPGLEVRWKLRNPYGKRALAK